MVLIMRPKKMQSQGIVEIPTTKGYNSRSGMLATWMQRLNVKLNFEKWLPMRLQDMRYHSPFSAVSNQTINSHQMNVGPWTAHQKN